MSDDDDNDGPMCAEAGGDNNVMGGLELLQPGTRPVVLYFLNGVFVVRLLCIL